MRTQWLCTFAIVLIMVAGGNAKDRVDDAGTILKKIGNDSNSIIDYKGYTINGDLDLGLLGEEVVKKPIRFEDSAFDGAVNFSDKVFLGGLIFENVSFNDKADFRNALFNCEVQFSKANFAKAADFSGSKFNGSSVSFSGSDFQDNALFEKAVFNGVAIFNYVRFLRNVDFTGSQFEGAKFTSAKFLNAYFDDSLFLKSATFDNSDFAIAEFSEANFLDNLTLLSCDFSQLADFTGCSFKKGVKFDKSRFYKESDFLHSEFYGPASFRVVTYAKKADFTGTYFADEADLSESNFQDDVLFFNSHFMGRKTNFLESVLAGNANFRRSQFSGQAHFNESAFNGDVDFYKADFIDNAYFCGCKFIGVADFFKAEFDKYADFSNTEFKSEAFFEESLFKGTLDLKKAEYDKLYIRIHDINQLKYNETVYKSLIENFKKIGFFDDANKCYYLFMKDYAYENLPGFGIVEGMDKNLDGDFGTLKVESFGGVFISIYYLFSLLLYGFGTRPEFTLLWSIFIIIVFGIVWHNWQRDPEENCDEYNWNEYWQTAQDMSLKANLSRIAAAFLFSATIFLSGTKFFIDPPKISEELKKLTPWAMRMYNLERFLGGAFSILFFIAIGSIVFSI